MKTAILAALIFIAGCGQISAQSTAAQNTQPSISGKCAITSTKPYDANTAVDIPSPTYSVTLTNASDNFTDISAIATTFDDVAGNEITSDTQYVTGVIAPGKSLMWTFNVPSNLVSSIVVRKGGGWLSGPDEWDQYIVNAASCHFAQWG